MNESESSRAGADLQANEHDGKSLAQNPAAQQSWVPGAITAMIGTIIGIISLALFCYALGLNFEDEGWATADGQAPQVKRIPLFAAGIGVVVATLLFWWGFVQLTRLKRHEIL